MGRKIYTLGTLHISSFHPSYGEYINSLKSFIDGIEPDSIFVELPTGEKGIKYDNYLEKLRKITGNYEFKFKGDMEFAEEYGKKRGIPVNRFDVRDVVLSEMEKLHEMLLKLPESYIDDLKDLYKIFAKIPLKRIMKNLVDSANNGGIFHYTEPKYEEMMAQIIKGKIEEKEYKKPLVIAGAWHILPGTNWNLRSYLENLGYEIEAYYLLLDKGRPVLLSEKELENYLRNVA